MLLSEKNLFMNILMADISILASSDTDSSVSELFTLLSFMNRVV
jgi:hypothetical protein